MAEVRQTFRASRIGTIAGCHVTQGKITRGPPRCASCATARSSTTARIGSLQRFKDDVREVEEGFECGIVLENFQDVKEGDVIEAYETRQVERELELGRTAAAMPFVVAADDSPSPAGQREPEGQAQGAAVGARGALAPVRRSGRRGRRPGPLAARDARGRAGRRLGRRSSSAPRTASSAICSAGSPRASGSSGGWFRSRTSTPDASPSAAAGKPFAAARAGIGPGGRTSRRYSRECRPRRSCQSLPWPKNRMRRVNEAVREVLSRRSRPTQGPARRVRDGHAVDTSPDLRHARVFVSVLGDEQQREESLAGLISSHGYLQSRVASRAAAEAHAAARRSSTTRAPSG